MTLYLGKTVQKDLSILNTTSTFLPTASGEEHRYNNALEDPIRRKILELNNHIPNNMNYRFNNYGFRGEDFIVGTDCDVCIGSSNTWGGGNYEENIYPSLIAKQTGRTVYNLGHPAGTADGCYRYSAYWLPKLMPKTVYSVWPAVGRTEIILSGTDELTKNKIKWAKHISKAESKRKTVEDEWPNDNSEWFGKYFGNTENSTINNLKNLHAIKQICDTIGAEFIVARPTVINLTDLSAELQAQDTVNIQGGAWPHGDIGRDFKHRGSEFHKLITEYLLNRNDYGNLCQQLERDLWQ